VDYGRLLTCSIHAFGSTPGSVSLYENATGFHSSMIENFLRKKVWGHPYCTAHKG
jgi:hypothetical protein